MVAPALDRAERHDAPTATGGAMTGDRAPRAAPLLLVAVGLVVIAVDFRTRSVDWLPDPAGWLLVAAGGRACNVRPVVALAVLAALGSLAEVALPYRIVAIDPITAAPLGHPARPAELFSTRQQWDALPPWRVGLLLAAATAGSVAAVMMVEATARRAQACGATRAAWSLRACVAALALLWFAPLAASLGWALAHHAAYDPVWNGTLAWIGDLGVLSMVATALALAAMHREPWAHPAEAARPSPWAMRRSGRAGS